MTNKTTITIDYYLQGKATIDREWIDLSYPKFSKEDAEKFKYVWIGYKEFRIVKARQLLPAVL